MAKTVNDRERAQYRAQRLKRGSLTAVAVGGGMAALGTPTGREVARVGVLTGKVAGKKAAKIYRGMNTAGKAGVGVAAGGATAALASRSYDKRQGRKINYQTRFGKSAFGVEDVEKGLQAAERLTNLGGKFGKIPKGALKDMWPARKPRPFTAHALAIGGGGAAGYGVTEAATHKSRKAKEATIAANAKQITANKAEIKGVSKGLNRSTVHRITDVGTKAGKYGFHSDSRRFYTALKTHRLHPDEKFMLGTGAGIGASAGLSASLDRSNSRDRKIAGQKRTLNRQKNMLGKSAGYSAFGVNHYKEV
jgi:hypothetical protein